MKSLYPLIYTALGALAFSFVVGYLGAHALAGGLAAMFLTAVLAVLETSLSFDNALVNATVLRKMTAEWQHRFLTWGMVIAVFGMRLLFPVLVVSGVAGLAPWHAIHLAFFDPAAYATLMQGAHVPLSGYGGAFLTMVALEFFMDPEKDTHWFRVLEKPLSWLGRLPGLKLALGIAAVCGASYLAPEVDQVLLLVSGMLGLASHLVIGALGSFSQSASAAADGVKRSGAAQFAYLELVDASFSFDGVIGAFALTDNLLLIATGLGLGALAVRHLTVQLVRVRTLAHLKYLEHGTFFAIAALGGFLLVGTSVAIPPLVTGCAGAVLIGASVLHSVLGDRKIRSSFANTAQTFISGAMRVGIAGLLIAWTQMAWNVMRGPAAHEKPEVVAEEIVGRPDSEARAPFTKTAAPQALAKIDTRAAEPVNRAADSDPRLMARENSYQPGRGSERALDNLRAVLKEAAESLPADGGAELKIVRDANILLSAFRGRHAPADIFSELADLRMGNAESVEALNHLADVRGAEWIEQLSALDAENAMSVGTLFEILGAQAWGDLLEAHHAGCAEELILHPKIDPPDERSI